MIHFLAELRRMARFYFHKHHDGETVRRPRRAVLRDEQAACRYALREVAAVIGSLAPTITVERIGIEVNDLRILDAL
jgi:hypothetical protein